LAKVKKNREEVLKKNPTVKVCYGAFLIDDIQQAYELAPTILLV